MKKLPAKISFEDVTPEYEKLVMLKKACMFDDEDDITEGILLERAREHNLVEIYLIGYLVDRILNAPKEVKAQNDLLIGSYANPQEYAQVKKQTKKLFKTNPKFRKYATEICSDLDLISKRNCAIANMMIFGLAPKIISATVGLEPNNLVLNLHILQKWLSEQRPVDFHSLNDVEQRIILYLANGYNADEILTEGVIRGIDFEEDRLRTILYEILPARCNVQSVCQVMAVIFANNHEVYDLEKSLRMFENLHEDNDF